MAKLSEETSLEIDGCAPYIGNILKKSVDQDTTTFHVQTKFRFSAFASRHAERTNHLVGICCTSPEKIWCPTCKEIIIKALVVS